MNVLGAMHRRKFFLSASAVGIVGVGSCLSATECDEPSNHLYVENQLPEPQEVAVQVLRKSDSVFADQQWTETFQESIELSGESYRVVEGIYDEHGTYRTVAERERNHDTIYNRETVDVTDCHGQSFTIGIADSRIDMFRGVPDHLSPGTDSSQ